MTLPIYTAVDNQETLEIKLKFYESLCNKENCVHRIATQTGYTYVDNNFCIGNDANAYTFPVVLGYTENDKAYILDPTSLSKLLERGLSEDQ